MKDECLIRVHCILKHVDQINRDGLQNSLCHLQKIEQDARALEDIILEGDSGQPVHLD